MSTTEIVEPTEQVKPKRRTNAEILADQVAQRKTRKRVRRTKAQIEADNAAEAKRRAELAEKRAAHIPTPRPIKFKKNVRVLVNNFWAFGNQYNAGDSFTVAEGTREFGLSFDAFGNFVFSKTPEEQLETWGVVKYEVED